MPATFRMSNEVQVLAEALIEEFHQHLLLHRVRMEYLFSDQEPQTKGKRKYGDVKKVSSWQAFLVGQPEQPRFETPTFVCTKCKKWGLPEELAELEVNADTFDFCQPCFDEVVEWEFEKNNGNIAKIVNWREMAKQKYDGGLPEGSTDFFVVTVYESYFRFATDIGKKFIVNHLLCHCGANINKHGDVNLYFKPHDVEEFTENIKAFGVETYHDLDRFANVCAEKKRTQLTLLDINDPVPGQGEQDESKLATAA